MKYYTIEGTPLKFHTFYRYVSMPLGAISAIISVFSYIATMDNPYYLIDIFFSLVQAVACGVAFFGFFNWKPSAWYAVMVNLANSVIYTIVVLGINIMFGTSDIAYSFGTVIGSSITSALIMIYYNKRKPLFFGTPAPAEKPVYYSEPARVCPNCGNPVTDAGNFCTNCGSSLRG